MQEVFRGGGGGVISNYLSIFSLFRANIFSTKRFSQKPFEKKTG